MVNQYPILVVAITSFVVGLTLLFAGSVLELLGVRGAGMLIMPAMSFNYIGVLGIWLWRTAKEQTERLDRLEAQLSAKTQG